MASLNQLAQQLADSLSRPFDKLLIERLKDLIVQQRATLLQRTMDKDGVDKEYRQTYYPEIEITQLDEIKTSGDIKVYKTVNRIPKPLRWKNYTPFFYVGTENGRKAFSHGNYYTASLRKHLPFIGNIITYDYIDGYVYIFVKDDVVEINSTATLSTPIRIDQVLANPRLVRTNNHNDTRENCIMFTDDMEFPMPMDLQNAVKDSIRELYNVDIKVPLEKTHVDNN